MKPTFVIDLDDDIDVTNNVITTDVDDTSSDIVPQNAKKSRIFRSE